MARGGNEENNSDFNLDITPVINCTTVLITFLLLSASFIKIGLLDAGVSAAGKNAKSDEEPPPIHITVMLKPNHSIKVKVIGEQNKTYQIKSTQNAKWNYQKLLDQIESLKEKWPETKALTLEADGEIAYQHVVHTMDKVEEKIPGVVLGGF